MVLCEQKKLLVKQGTWEWLYVACNANVHIYRTSITTQQAGS